MSLTMMYHHLWAWVRVCRVPVWFHLCSSVARPLFPAVAVGSLPRCSCVCYLGMSTAVPSTFDELITAKSALEIGIKMLPSGHAWRSAASYCSRAVACAETVLPCCRLQVGSDGLPSLYVQLHCAGVPLRPCRVLSRAELDAWEREQAVSAEIASLGVDCTGRKKADKVVAQLVERRDALRRRRDGMRLVRAA
eukprot:5666603-Pleurochrysis_carterae.AAC.1